MQRDLQQERVCVVDPRTEILSAKFIFSVHYRASVEYVLAA